MRLSIKIAGRSQHVSPKSALIRKVPVRLECVRSRRKKAAHGVDKVQK